MSHLKRKLPEPPSAESVPPLHRASYPESWRPPEVTAERRKPAKEFPFSLDQFQSDAIRCLDNGESVMVSAHTPAGKAVIASYTIAMCLRDNQRVVYTSHTKALGNQKYKEFKQEFSDVGLISGDVSINSGASCLVMTTELLRRMMYKGSEVIRQVAWIIFDEVHYIGDKERGVVWEECIIMAHEYSRFVFLSAVVPNAKEFADWVAKVRHRPCHVAYTEYRPVPLRHYVFPAGGDGLYLAVDEQGKFLEESFQKSMKALVSTGGEKRRENRKWKKSEMFGKHGEDTDIFKMLKMIIQRRYDPVILFSFSKRECEFLALQTMKLDLNEEDEKVKIEIIFSCAMDLLSDDDKKLPQVTNMLPILKRGIGIHHSGLLPVLREVIELLFQEGLIKCIFATETFSIGMNIPVKTVVFTNVRKFDEDKFRWLSSGEYIQMSSRAGRRGVDDCGICVLMVDEKMEPSTAKMMFKGSADPLNSSFHLSYNILLNQMRTEDEDPYTLLRHSFYQFQADWSLPDLEKQAKALKAERDSIIIEEEENLKDYCNLLQQYKILRNDVRDIIFSQKHCLPFLQPGRLLRLLCVGDDKMPCFSTEEHVTWGVIINFEKVNGIADDRKTEDADYTINVLTRCSVNKENVSNKIFNIVPLYEKGEAAVVCLPLSQIDRLSVIRLRQMPKDLLPLESREATLQKVLDVCSGFIKDGIPLLDPEEDMNIQSNAYRKAIRRMETLESLFDRHELQKSPLVQQNLKVLYEKQNLTEKIKSVKKMVRNSTELSFKDEFKARKRVLRRLGYITNEGIVALKGKFACEISCADELTLTELVLSGVLKDTTAEEMVALLSCFVWQEKLQDARKPREELDLLFSQLQETARQVVDIQIECKIQCDVESFVNSFRPDIMEAVYAWANGSKFYEILEIAQVFEGSLVKAIRRLEEVLQQLILASKAIGEMHLESKLGDAVTKIKRDIVFAPSLYT